MPLRKKVIILFSLLFIQIISLTLLLLIASSRLFYCGDATIINCSENQTLYVKSFGFVSAETQYMLKANDTLTIPDSWVSSIEFSWPAYSEENRIRISTNNSKFVEVYPEINKNSIILNDSSGIKDAPILTLISSSLRWHGNAGIFILLFWIIQLAISLFFVLALLYQFLLLLEYRGFIVPQSANDCTQLACSDKQPRPPKGIPWVSVVALALFVTGSFIHPHGRIITTFNEEIKAIQPALEMRINHEYCTPTFKGEEFWIKPQGIYYYYALLGEIPGFNYTTHQILIANQALNLAFIFLLLFFLRSEYGIYHSLRISVLFLCAPAVAKFFGEVYSDNLFNPVVFSGLFCIWYFLRRGKEKTAIYVSCAIFSLAFLLKGFPALIFLETGLICGFYLHGKWKYLFSFHHVAGILFMFLLIITPFIIFGKITEIPEMFIGITSAAIFHIKPMANDVGWLQPSVYFVFELTMIYLPLTILFYLLLCRRLTVDFFKNRMFIFLAGVFSLNFLVYLFSGKPEVKFLTAVFPFLLIVLYFLYDRTRENLRKVSDVLFFALLVCAFLIIAYLFKQFIVFDSHWYLPVLGIIVLTSILILFYKFKSIRLDVLALTFVLFSFSFRFTDSQKIEEYGYAQTQCEVAKQIASYTGNSAVYLYNAETIWNEDLLYYLTLNNKSINFQIADTEYTPMFIIVNKNQKVDPDFHERYTLLNDFEIFYADKLKVGFWDSPKIHYMKSGLYKRNIQK